MIVFSGSMGEWIVVRIKQIAPNLFVPRYDSFPIYQEQEAQKATVAHMRTINA